MIKHTLRAVRLVRMIWTANMTGCSWSWAVWKRPSACSLNKIRNGSVTSKWNDKKKQKKPLYCYNVRTASHFLIRRLHLHSDILFFPSSFSAFSPSRSISHSNFLLFHFSIHHLEYIFYEAISTLCTFLFGMQQKRKWNPFHSYVRWNIHGQKGTRSRQNMCYRQF